MVIFTNREGTLLMIISATSNLLELYDINEGSLLSPANLLV